MWSEIGNLHMKEEVYGPDSLAWMIPIIAGSALIITVTQPGNTVLM